MSKLMPPETRQSAHLKARRSQLAAQLALFQQKAVELRSAAMTMRRARKYGSLLNELEATAAATEEACAQLTTALSTIDTELGQRGVAR